MLPLLSSSQESVAPPPAYTSDPESDQYDLIESSIGEMQRLSAIRQTNIARAAGRNWRSGPVMASRVGRRAYHAQDTKLAQEGPGSKGFVK
jgi:hypothetical protein